MGRPKIYEDAAASNRARQAAYRQRQKEQRNQVVLPQVSDQLATRVVYRLEHIAKSLQHQGDQEVASVLRQLAVLYRR